MIAILGRGGEISCQALPGEHDMSLTDTVTPFQVRTSRLRSWTPYGDFKFNSVSSRFIKRRQNIVLRGEVLGSQNYLDCRGVHNMGMARREGRVRRSVVE